MGQLTLPGSGTVYVDTSPVIYAVEKVPPYAALLSPLWSAASAGRLQIVTSELTWLETLTKPMQEGNTVLEGLFRSFLAAEEVRLVPVDRDLWERAARLRGLGLRTPDAVHAATALSTACSLVVTNDSAFLRVPDLTVAVLDDFV